MNTDAKLEIRMPGKVVIVDKISDLPKVGIENTLYIVRAGGEAEFYEYKNKKYTQIHFGGVDESEINDIIERLDEQESNTAEHVNDIISEKETHGIKYTDGKLLIRLKDGSIVEFEGGGGGEIDLSEVEELIKNAVKDHEDKTVFKDRVHGLRIDGGIMEYWDHNEEEWVELFSSEFQTFPRVRNFVVVASETGEQLLGNWENPSQSPTYKRTEIYVSETDITSMELSDVQANGTKIVDSDTQVEFTHNGTLGKVYYFVAYAVHVIDDEEKYSSPRTATVLAADVTPPGNAENLKVSPLDQALSVSWTNPTDEDFAKVRGVWKKGGAPENSTDGEVFVDGADTSALIRNLANGEEYWVRLFTYDLNGNVNDSKEMIAKGVPNDAPATGPGPQELIAGDLEHGFYGEVPASELWTGTELSALLGITQGTIQFDDTPWLKWAYQGKTLFRPKKAFRHSISWNHLNEKGVVYGGKTITHENGYSFDVRLMKGALTDPSKNNDSDRGAKYSEWNRLMLPIHVQAKDKSWAYPAYVEDDIPYWGIDYTDADLQVGSGNGRFVWCQETPASNSSYRVDRGHGGVSYSDWNAASNTGASRGFAPVLELH